MIKLLFILLAIFFSYQIVTTSGIRRLVWYFAGILFVPNYAALIESPHITFNKLILYVLIFITLIDFKSINALRQFPFRAGLGVILIAYLVIGLSDERVNLFYKIYRPLDYFFRDFFILFLAWYYIRKEKDIGFIYNKLYYFFIAFCLYGFVNIISGYNGYHGLLTSGFDAVDFSNANMASDKERIRISSFVDQAIYYGFILGIMILVQIFTITTFKLSKAEKYKHYFLILLLLINLLLTNSRTPIFCLVAGGGLYILVALKAKQKILILLAACTIIVASTLISTDVQTLIQNTVKTFSTGEENFEGSSIQMRALQLAASFIIFEQSPITGNGFNYIIEGLGYSADENDRISEGAFYGFESYVYKLLIEQGLVGIVANIFFFILLARGLMKMRKWVNYEGNQMVLLSISILCSFILFIIGTGDMGSFPFVMAILGMNCKYISLSHNLPSRNE